MKQNEKAAIKMMNANKRRKIYETYITVPNAIEQQFHRNDDAIAASARSKLC